MSRTPQNAELARGTFKVLRVRVVDPAGSVVDLSGALTAEYKVARKLSAAAPLFEKSLGDGIEISDGPNGEIEITIDPADSAFLSGQHYHEAFITDIGGRRVRIFEGALTVLATL